MFRTTLISLAIGVMTGSALAGTPPTGAQAAAAANQIWIAGTPSATGLISVILQSSCDSTTFATFKSNHANFANDLNDGDSYTAYSCNLLATNDFGLPAGTLVTVNKRDRSGSTYGIYPVRDKAAIDFLNLATCTNGLCGGTVQHIPDAGISDLEPKMFGGVWNLPPEFSTAASISSSSFQSVTAVYGQTYGLAVSMPLYAALQAKQSTTDMPSMGVVAAHSFYGGQMINWNALGVDNANYQMNICRAANGSGVQAAANVYFGQNPNQGWIPATNNDSSIGSGVNDVNYIRTSPGTNDKYVYEAQNNSQLRNCFAAANSVGAYAVGVMQIGVATSTDYAFVRMEAGSPTRDAVKRGDYAFFFEATIQLKTGLTGVPKTFLTKLASRMQDPTYMAMLPGPIQQSILALPTTTYCMDADFNFGSFMPGSPQDTFCSRATRYGVSTWMPMLSN